MRHTAIFALLICLIASACREQESIIPSTQSAIDTPYSGSITGLYLLNEGNMGNNKCTLDYMDITTGLYHKNIYAERNPQVAKELGDVGNDLQIYRDRLYAVVNCSNLVEVMDASDATHIGVISIPNCRYICFDGDFAYVSSYAGPVDASGSTSRIGYIAKIDINTLEVVDTCNVGYQPEQMAIRNGKLYVANSGGYQVPNYDNRLMVIDLEKFEVVKEIEVADNLHHVLLDKQGKLWISSRGDHLVTTSKIYVVDTETDSITKELDITCSSMTISGAYLYIISHKGVVANQGGEVDFIKISTSNYEIVEQNIITDGSEKSITLPYNIAINPESGLIYITDAKDYITPGELLCYNPDGALRWRTTTGDIPAQIAFTTK